MENKESFSLFPDFRFEEKIENPLELISHSNVISTNDLNTINANAIEKSKLGEAGFVKYDIFSPPALVEKVCSDNIFYLPYVMFLVMLVLLILLKYLQRLLNMLGITAI
jgi:hypothetical protein